MDYTHLMERPKPDLIWFTIRIISTKLIPRGNWESSSNQPSGSDQGGMVTLMGLQLGSIKMFSLLSESDIVLLFAAYQNVH